MTADGNPAIFATCTETPARSQRRIFTCRKTKIATSPFVYKGATVFLPEKLGNLQGGYLRIISKPASFLHDVMAAVPPAAEA